MKKLLFSLVIIFSLTLLGAKCNKTAQQQDNSQITIPVKLTEENVKKAIDKASEELDWPYAPTGADRKQWMIGEGARYVLTHNLNVSKDGKWAERKQKLCRSNKTGFNFGHVKYS